MAGLALGRRVFAPGREPRRNEAIAWSISWLALALAVAAAIGVAGGPVDEWTTVYLIERSLSLDNIFVFTLSRPPTGFRENKLFVREGGRLMGTPLLLTVVAIMAADIALAIDSIPVAFAVTRDPAVIWTSNAFALIVGLLGCGVAASVVADRLTPPHPAEEARRRPPRLSRAAHAAPAQARGGTLWLSAERGVRLRAGRGLSHRGLALVRAGRLGCCEACPHGLQEFAPGPIQAHAIDEEGRRRVDSSSPAALDVGEDALSKRVLAKSRVGLRWLELKSPGHREQVVV